MKLLTRCWNFLLTKFAIIFSRACAVELAFSVVAQFGAGSSVRTGVVFTALVITWLIWACVVRLEEKKNVCKKSKFTSLPFDFRQLRKIISAAKFNFAATNQFLTQASTLPTLPKRKKKERKKNKTKDS